MLGTVSKAGRVLDLFTPALPEWGVSEVACQLQVSKSSAHALLSTLNEIGLVRRLPDGRYRLGWRILELNRSLLQSTDFLSGSTGRMQLLADQLQATIHVAAVRDHSVLYLEKIRGAHSPDIGFSAVGLSAPAHCTALGKVLLASSDDAYTDAVIERYGLARRTPETITSLPRLRTELDAIRLRGWGLDREEAVTRVCCVAAPVRDAHGGVQAAISISLSTSQYRRNPEGVRRSVQKTAAWIGRAAYRTEPLMSGDVR
ncbi:IclR family transcriptional regulator [Streptomyces sp. NPDC098781]|uniref:IclR family transcriptional regulator n=1 Tax=Streptomyces sp. NPDC098781 TaxID=3366097 RepID=UPI00382D852D